MKVKTSELSGRALDWAAWATEEDLRTIQPRKGYTLNIPKFSSDWAKCGLLIERYKLHLVYMLEGRWKAVRPNGCSALGELKIAICLAAVSAKFGDEVEIPDELMEVK